MAEQSTKASHGMRGHGIDHGTETPLFTKAMHISILSPSHGGNTRLKLQLGYQPFGGRISICRISGGLWCEKGQRVTKRAASEF